MVTIVGTILLTGFFGTAAWLLYIKDLLKKPSAKDSRVYFTIILAIGLAVRVIAAVSFKGHTTDMGCFIGWSDKIFKDGISQFYLSDSFHDYPPGYVYVMYVLGAIKNTFNLRNEALWLLIKLPSIICDLFIGVMVYKAATKRVGGMCAAALCALVIFNPALILNGSVWGQVDSVLGIFCVASIWLACEKRLIPSFFAFGAAVLIKPQALFIAPILVFAVVEQVILDKDEFRKSFLKTVLGAIGAILAVFVLFMPFGNNPIHGIQVIINQYMQTIGQYNYVTVNAFNLYGALGKNWVAVTPFSSIFGYTAIVLVVCASGYVFFKRKSDDRYFAAAFVLVFGIFMLSVKMHERYAFGGILMLIFALVYAPTDMNALFYMLISLSQFFNMAWVLFIYEKDPSKYFTSSAVNVASIINLLIFAAYMYNMLKSAKLDAKATVLPKSSKKSGAEADAPKFQVSEKAEKLVAADLAIMLIMTVIYGAVAFYKLGDRFAPQTETEILNNEITVDFGEEKEILNTAFFLGARQLEEDRNLTIKYLDQNGKIVYNDIVTSGDVFKWTVCDEINQTARYVVISSNAQPSPDDATDKIYLKEICFIDKNGGIIEPINKTDEGCNELFDEQQYMTAEKSYMSGTYFDEIYHARTAYEFIHHMSVYEWTHPPLGKVLMGIGILIFGMVPFGWRFIGTLFGVFMVPAVYLFAKRMLKYRWLAVVTSLLFVFDFMHYTQTRIATIDTYVTFFIIVMYYYMYKYYKKSFYDTPLVKTLVPLGISGVFFGLSAASKWTGIYAGAGLAVIFFKTIYDRYREYCYALKNPDGFSGDISHKTVIDTFKKNTIITILFCCVTFVIIPFAIYAVSYIPYLNTPSGAGLKTIFTNAEQMLTYHSKTVVDSTHPFSSHWYEWPIMYRPIWYFSNTLDNGLKQGISAFGNPAVWWMGIIALAHNFAIAVIVPLKKKDYFGKNKYMFGTLFIALCAVICMVSALAISERTERIFSCVSVYAIIMSAVFIIMLVNDEWLKNASSKTAWFLLIGYFAGYLPWTLVVRTTYIYHYFPCVIFVVLMIGNSIKTIYDNAQNKKSVRYGAIIYAAVAVGLFIMFYPVLSGQPVSLEFAEKWLKWFSSWVLV